MNEGLTFYPEYQFIGSEVKSPNGQHRLAFGGDEDAVSSSDRRVIIFGAGDPRLMTSRHDISDAAIFDNGYYVLVATGGFEIFDAKDVSVRKYSGQIIVSTATLHQVGGRLLFGHSFSGPVPIAE